LNAQAEAYLEELRAATAAAHDRLRAGIMRLQPQTHVDEPMPEPVYQEPSRATDDPIFATREFDVPPSAVAGLVDFDTDAGGIPIWKD